MMALSRCVRLVVVAVSLLSVTGVAAQVVRLPAVTAEPRGTAPGQLTAYPGAPAELLQAPAATSLPEQPERPADARPGMFQKLLFDAHWLAPGEGRGGFGVNDMQLRSVLALPIPSRDYPLIITPGFAVYYWDGPPGSDLPPRVYDAYTQFRWMRRLSARWGIDLAITPGVFTDFQQGSNEGFRLTGHGAAQWSWTPKAKLVLGAAYIDRYSTDVLPICGIRWTPHEEVEYDLVFPHPRIARRLHLFAPANEQVEHWGYVAGEFGGGVWAVERSGGLEDTVDYTDYRLLLGVERRLPRGLGARLEIGYVFGRKLRFESPTPRILPDDTILIGGALSY